MSKKITQASVEKSVWREKSKLLKAIVKVNENVTLDQGSGNGGCESD